MTNIAPAPWVFISPNHKEAHPIYDIVDDDGDILATIQGESYHDNKAHALLFIAAPELLKALIEIDNAVMDIDGYKGRQGTWEVVRNAIANAKGE